MLWGGDEGVAPSLLPKIQPMERPDATERFKPIPRRL
jgi:hypothetical protein